MAKKLFFDIGGIGRVNAMPGSTFSPGGSNREPIIADTGVVDFDEEPVAPTMEFDIPVDARFGMDVLRDLKNIIVTVQDDAGQVWSVAGCCTTRPPSQNSGKVSISMAGLRADKVN